MGFLCLYKSSSNYRTILVDHRHTVCDSAERHYIDIFIEETFWICCIVFEE